MIEFDNFSMFYVLSLLIVAFASASFLCPVLFGQLRHIPGPTYTLLTGLPLKWYTITGRKMYYVDWLHSRYGPIVRSGPSSVSVNDIASVRQVYALATGFNKSAWYSELNLFPKQGSFNMSSNREAASIRRILAHSFSNSSIRTNWEPVIRDYVQLAVSQIMFDAQRSGSADLFKWFTLMANDVGCRLMFGESFGQLQSGVKTDYIKKIETYTMLMSILAELPPMVRFICKNLPFKTNFTDVDSHMAHGVKAVANARAGGTKANIYTGLVTKHGFASSDGSLDELTVIVEAMNNTIAASDTTAITLTYLVWCVMRRPQLRERLERELADLPEDFCDADLEKLPWLGAIINETLRLYGAGSGALPREVPAGGATINDLVLPAGITVSAQAYSMHRKDEIFEDALTFDPSRFLREQTEAEKVAFAPWGRGARFCLGIHMARMQLRYGAAMLFRTDIRDPTKRLRLASTATDESMKQADFFLTPPVSHRCEVVFNVKIEA